MGGLHNQKKEVQYCIGRRERERETLHASIVLVLEALCHKDLGAVECERYHSTVCIIHEIVLARGAPRAVENKTVRPSFSIYCTPLCMCIVHVHIRIPMCFLGI